MSKKEDLISKTTTTKKGWRCGSRGRASQEQSPEFKILVLLKVNDKIKKGEFHLLLF
jgi:hypothetical protein